MKFLLKYGKANVVLLAALTSFLIFLNSHYVLTPSFFENSGAALSAIPGRSQAVYQSLQGWVYGSSILFLLIKVTLITIILNIGLYLNGHTIPFLRIFNVAVIGEYIFLLPAAIKICTFKYLFPDGTLAEWHRYYPLSLLSIVNELPADWSYILETLNLFELGYWTILGIGISRICDLPFLLALKVVLIYYVPSLVIWVISLTFLMLVMFPDTA